jgi:alpha-tubulin suppressor-like RCC1 family protein
MDPAPLMEHRPRSRSRSRFQDTRNWFVSVAVIAWILVLAGCEVRRTAIALRIDTDMVQGPAGEVSHVRVTVFARGSTEPSFTQTLELTEEPGAAHLPFVARTISPGDVANAESIVVEVAALQQSRLLFVQRAMVSFAAGTTSLLDMFLAGHCRWDATMCSAGMTCGRSACEPELRTSLPVYDPGADGGNVDATPGPDGGRVGGGDNVATGSYHSCTIQHGQLSCWGRNGDGSLGIGNTVMRNVPSVVGGGTGWVQVVGGEAHTCALDADGAAWCWGRNDVGQLGLGGTDTNVRLVPTRVSGSQRFVRLTTRFDTTCGITMSGALWCWGENREGQLAQDDPFPGTGRPRSSPVAVATSRSWHAVSAGHGHTCAVAMDGTLWCWGRNIGGQLGIGTVDPGQIRVPLQVGTGHNWTEVDCGQDTSCALQADNSLWCWGWNGFGQVGRPPTSEQVISPVRVGTDGDWVEVRVNTFATCGRRRNGTLWCWGRNAEGQLGVGSITDLYAPTQVMSAITDWVEIAAGRFHTCARRANNTVWCAGENDEGQLGVGDLTRRSILTNTMLPVQP